MIVEKVDLEEIMQSALYILDKATDSFVGGTAIDILAVLEKYIQCTLWRSLK